MVCACSSTLKERSWCRTVQPCGKSRHCSYSMAAQVFDHSIYKPAYSALAESAQVIYLDHRGNGRSDDGPQDGWNLAQWGDDVRAFCDVLGIVDPIVLGASFGGMVALSYATRHPGHPSKLILISTEARGGSYRERRVELFERFGGPEVGALARRRFLELEGHPGQASLQAWL